jgi:DNA-binding response OmpR family regulator
MERQNLAAGKRILIVDDEPDVLETLVELLAESDVVKASSFDEAKALLDTQYFDVAVLDIMGVDGYKLLEMAVAKKIIAVMLTARAISPEDTVKSFKSGAAFFVPKDEMVNIEAFINDVLEAKKEKRNPWDRWVELFTPLYNKRFGPDWQNRDKEFWDKFLERYMNW